MFKSINEQYRREKKRLAENAFILESVLDVEEVIPGSDEELDSVVDTDSVPDEAYRKVDDVLERIVTAPDYDDTEAEEMVDDDDGLEDDEELNGELDAIIDETQGLWYDDENLGHTNISRRSSDPGATHQAVYRAEGQKSL